MKLTILGLFLYILALVFGMTFGFQDLIKLKLFISVGSFIFIVVATIGTLLIGFRGHFISSVTLIWKKDSINPRVDRQILDIGIQFWKAARRYVIVSGFIGTFIGMVFTLHELGKDDLSGLGPAISFSLITLFYGLILYLHFDPIVCLLETKQSSYSYDHFSKVVIGELKNEINTT